MIEPDADKTTFTFLTQVLRDMTQKITKEEQDPEFMKLYDAYLKEWKAMAEPKPFLNMRF